MIERDPLSLSFDAAAVGEVLGPPGPVEDSDLGPGRRYRTAGNQVTLDIFPAARVTRLRDEGVRVQLAGIPTVQRAQVVLTHLDRGDTEVTLTADQQGCALIYAHTTPASPPDPPAPRAPDRTHTSDPPPRAADRAEQPPPAAHIDQLAPPRPTPGSAAPAEPPRRTAPPAAETERHRLQLTGRLGRDPSFRTTTTGTLVGKFPLAVHQDDGTTRWHSVLAFGARAEQLQRRTQTGELARGREVDVVGYLHTNTRPGKDGTPRKVQEVYAVAVKKR